MPAGRGRMADTRGAASGTSAVQGILSFPCRATCGRGLLAGLSTFVPKGTRSMYTHYCGMPARRSPLGLPRLDVSNRRLHTYPHDITARLRDLSPAVVIWTLGTCQLRIFKSTCSPCPRRLAMPYMNTPYKQTFDNPRRPSFATTMRRHTPVRDQISPKAVRGC